MPIRHDRHVSPPRPAWKGRRWLVTLSFVAWIGLLSAAEPALPAAAPIAAPPTVASSKVEAVLHVLVQYKWAVLVLLLSLVGIIHIVRKLATESERRKLNLLQRCLIGSIILHLLAGFLVTTWVVSNAVKRSVIEVSSESGLVPIDLASLSGESEGGGGGEADPRLLQALREQVSNLPRAGAGMSVARAAGQSGGGGAPVRNGNVMTGGATGRVGPSATFTVAESSPTENGRLETASASTLAPQAAQMNGSLEARADTSVPRPEMARPTVDLTAPSRMAVQQVTPEMARPTMNVRVQRPGTSASRMVQVATAESPGATGESASATPSLSAASAAGAAASMSAATTTTGVQMESARPVAASAAGPTMQNPSSRMDTARGAVESGGATSARAEMNPANSPARVNVSRGAAASAVGSFAPANSGSAQGESLGAASAAGSMAAAAGGNSGGATSPTMQMEAGRLGGGATGAKSGAGLATASSQMNVARAAGSEGASGSASSSRAQMGNGALAGGAAGTARGSSAVGSFGPVSNGNSGGAGEGLSASSSASSLSSSVGGGSAGGSAGGGMQMEAGRLGGGATGAKSGTGLAGASSRMDVSRAGNGSGSGNGGSTAPGRAAMGNGALAGGRAGVGQGGGSSAVGSFGPVSGGGGSSGGLGAASSAGSLSSFAGGGSAGGSAGSGMQMEAGRLGGGATGAKSGAGLAGASSRMDVSRSGSGNGGSTAPGRAAMGTGAMAGGKNGAGRGTGSSAVGTFGSATGGGSGGGESLGAAGASRTLAGLPQFAMAGGGGFRAEMASPAAGPAGKGADVGRASSKVGVNRAGGSGLGEGGAGGGLARMSGSGGSSGGASKFGSFAAAQKVEFGSGTGESGRGLGAVNFGQQPASLKFGSTEMKLETKPASVAASPKPAPLPEVRPAPPIAPMRAAPIATKVERPVGLVARVPMDLAPLRPVLQPSAKIESVELSRPSELPTSSATRLVDMAVPVRPAVAALIDTKNPLALRSVEMRAGLIEQLGGSDETEAAVRRALDWFKRTQERDGHWTRGGLGHHSSATALAMLCFMGYGAKHTEPGPYQETLDRALAWLLKQSKAGGDLRGDGDLYDQAIVTLALAEAFNLTKDPRLQEPVRKAVSFIVTAQNKQTGGWRYKPWSRDPQEKGDLSVTGWQIMALKSAALAGVEVPADTFAGAGRFIESLGRGRQGGLYGYRAADPEPKATMTAQALFSRLLLGQGTGDARTAETLVYLREQLPSPREVNYYYWYYGCLALYQHQGALWEEWNARMRPIFLKAQRRDGQLSGSWDAEGDRKESYGRFVTTALATLSLEVYYRYLPLYKPTLTAASEPTK